MNTYYLYHESSLDYLGQLEAIDSEAAQLLASIVCPQPHKLTTFRLSFNRQIAQARV